jgi:hypothetical protein
MAYKLVISAESPEQTEGVIGAVREALVDCGMELPKSDPPTPQRKQMFPPADVVTYIVSAVGSVGLSVVANAIYARLKFLHPKDEIANLPVGSGFEVVNHTSGARVEVADGAGESDK